MFIVAALAATLSVGTVSDSATRIRASSDASDRVEIEFTRKYAARIPSFSRQTKLACSMCHNGFPQLTSFGRLFKLNGYTLTGLPMITAQQDSASRVQLSLSPIAPLSLMAIIGTTNVATPAPGTLSTTTEFPQQLSLFAASALSPNMGIFSQLTYTAQDGRIGIDNVDLRYARHMQFGDHDAIVGLTLNNNPTVQDVWNTTPAWGYPFASASVAPSPAASTIVEGALGQAVLGLGAYTLFNNAIYAELSGYVAAPQGSALPLDSTAAMTPKAISPYWRVALQHDMSESTYLMVGAFGLSTDIFPTGVTGSTNHYTDLGFDAQLEQKVGKGMLIGRASYIHEDQTLPASYNGFPQTAQNPTNTLSTYKFNLSWMPSQTHTLTVGYFGISGASDNQLYASEPVTGSATGSPASQGEIFELSANPWMNVRFGAQYVAYQKFNGRSTSYDLSVGGRNASNNNTLFLYLWLAY
jgi:hypothetical protein